MPPVITLPKLNFQNFNQDNLTKTDGLSKTGLKSSTTTVRFCIEIDHGTNERQILWPKTVKSYSGNSNSVTKTRDFREFYFDADTDEILESEEGAFEKTADLESTVQLDPSDYCQKNAGFEKKLGGSSLYLDIEYTVETQSNWNLMYRVFFCKKMRQIAKKRPEMTMLTLKIYFKTFHSGLLIKRWEKK